jgi:thiol-disulfide isomerase/thioredoxin
MRVIQIFVGLAMLTIILSSACSSPPATTVSTGIWRAWLDSPGGPLPFGLDISRGDSGLAASLINGPEWIAIPAISIEGDQVRIEMDHYDSIILARLSPDGQRMDGEWQKTAGPDTLARLSFHAEASTQPRFAPDPSADDTAVFAGRWRMQFDQSVDSAVGIFEAEADSGIHGTVLTTTGDYRYLAGNVSGRRLRLSCFDGAHAFLFDAQLDPDGTLRGDFWSRDSWHDSWTATLEPEAELPDPFDQTHWVEGRELAEAVFPDLDGTPQSLIDPAYAGKARIIEIFGTWCPNCKDASAFMVELDGRYRDAGLSIVGLAFELTGEFDRDARQVRTYARHQGIEYPILIGGNANKDEASLAFPWVDRIRSFPTTIFLHRDGRVRAVHSGYSGPATGPANTALRETFESLIQELLNEDG